MTAFCDPPVYLAETQFIKKGTTFTTNYASAQSDFLQPNESNRGG
jgi:hypothetical protein